MEIFVNLISIGEWQGFEKGAKYGAYTINIWSCLHFAQGMGVMMGKAPKTDKSHAVFKKISYIIINNYVPPPPTKTAMNGVHH